MLNKNKEIIVNEIMELLIKLTSDETGEPSKSPPTEMLTIKECTRAAQGVSQHTIRQPAPQDKIKHLRPGEGKRGKILVNKADLLAYFGA